MLGLREDVTPQLQPNWLTKSTFQIRIESWHPTPIQYVSSFATPVVLSDGDQLFQRWMIRTSGTEEAVGRNVLVYVHRDQNTHDIQRRFPAARQVMVGEEARIRAAMKAGMGEKVTTAMAVPPTKPAATAAPNEKSI
jgi:hypothetical protein